MLIGIVILIEFILAASIVFLAFAKNIKQEKRNISAAIISFVMIGVFIAFEIIKHI